MKIQNQQIPFKQLYMLNQEEPLLLSSSHSFYLEKYSQSLYYTEVEEHTKVLVIRKNMIQNQMKPPCLLMLDQHI